MYGSLSPGDVVLADALFDNYFLACELRWLGVDLVARVQAERVGSRTVESRPDGDVILWQRPNKPRGMTGEEYRRYPKALLMRQVTVDARDQDNRAERFEVVTTILDASIDGGQIGDLYERRWDGEVCQADDIPRCGLYPPPRLPHSERGGAAAPGPLVPGAPSRHRRAAAMRSDSERPAPPRPQAA
jgi:hypothetical protein